APAAQGAAAVAAAGVDLVAVILVVRHPVNLVEGAVVVLQRVVIVVPEALEALFLGRQALVALGENVPPGLAAAVVQRAAAAAAAFGAGGGAGGERQTQGGANDQCDPFHCDSFAKFAP